jgi:hypothetical protein
MLTKQEAVGVWPKKICALRQNAHPARTPFSADITHQEHAKE